HICSAVLASYDPNNKLVLPTGIGPEGFVSPETELTYTINFQNTGNYPAEDIYILDTLDQDLDVSSIQILGASHNIMTPYLHGNTILFDFEDIWLADSVSNEPESHGFVTYSIKTKPGLAQGTQIKNSASIYFDYNLPVLTNS